jgi:ATP-dependent RNA helicase RhlE
MPFLIGAVMLFSQLNLPDFLLANISKLGFTETTEVQEKAIPLALAGKDIVAQAATGSGKTLAFLAPVLSQLVGEINAVEKVPAPSALVLVPTRELAMQVADNAKQLGKNSGVKCVLAYGGVPLETQQKQLKQGVNLLVATPGRLLDLLKKRAIRLDKTTKLIFDEADRMLDMGFADEIRAIIKKLPSTRQTSLFSATFNDSLWQFIQTTLNQPERLVVAHQQQANANIEEFVYEVDLSKRIGLLETLINQHQFERVLVFSRAKEGADDAVKALQARSVNALAMHGDLSQKQREQNLADFHANKIKVLVATDVAARGIDIEQLPCVINLELPFKVEDYVHRVGRTGRNNHHGTAITFYQASEQGRLLALERYLDRRLPVQWYPGFEPDLLAHDAPNIAVSKGRQKQKARQAALNKK